MIKIEIETTSVETRLSIRTFEEGNHGLDAKYPSFFLDRRHEYEQRERPRYFESLMNQWITSQRAAPAEETSCYQPPLAATEA
jgi:hypothetical protein